MLRDLWEHQGIIGVSGLGVQCILGMAVGCGNVNTISTRHLICIILSFLFPRDVSI
jgi:hypothetical protein